jgi:opacity protein-like surface antigen
MGRYQMLKRRKVSMVIAAAVALAAAAPVHAQSTGDGFLFHRPVARISVRGGYAVARAGSDLFDFATENLTLQKRDFSGVSLGGAVDLTASDRVSFTLDVGYSRSKKGSEFRSLIDNNDLPIEQTTTFERTPITANLKLYLSAPGQSVGTAAWIPAKLAPWVGIGGGAMRYRFLQDGDFVDFQTNNVFRSSFNSDGWAPVLQGLAGADYSITPSLALTGEARYLLARGDLSTDFGGFNKIDLSGLSATIGLSFRL